MDKKRRILLIVAVIAAAILFTPPFIFDCSTLGGYLAGLAITLAAIVVFGRVLIIPTLAYLALAAFLDWPPFRENEGK